MSGNKVVEFLNENAIEDEAADWLIRMDGDEGLSNAEIAELQQWRERSPSHKAKLDEFAAIWDKANVLTELAVPIESSPSPSKLSNTAGKRPALRISSWVGYGAIAASLFVAVIMLEVPGSFFQSIDDSNGTYTTKVGQRQLNRLADGSQLQLNTSSRVRVDFNDQFRDVYLTQGEAHFDVAKNKDIPFRVFAGNGRIRAVGTAFSVYLKDSNNVDVVVSEGRVALAKMTKGVGEGGSQGVVDGPGSDETRGLEKKLGQLRAGEAVTIVGQASNMPGESLVIDDLIKIENIDVSKRISWTTGVLVFSGETLDEVVTELGRYTGVSIEFAQPELRTIRIGGRFPMGEAEIMLAALESNVGLLVRRLDNDRVVISDPNSN